MNRWLFSRSRRVLRVTTYLSAVTLVALLAASRAGYGRIQTTSLRMGDELLRLTDSIPGDAYRLRINGQPLNVATARVDKPFREVLEHFQRGCEEHADGLAEELAHLRDIDREGETRAPQGFPGAGVLRYEVEDHGVVVCFAQGAPTDHFAIFERLRQFGATGDLGKLGNLRYVFARQVGAGAHAVAVWSDGPFELEKMFPAEGDVPGTDAEDAYRPEGSRRLLAAAPDGVPYAIRMYETALPVEDALERCDRAMSRDGWETSSLVAAQLPRSRAYSRGDRDLFVVASAHEGRTLFSVSEMRSR